MDVKRTVALADLNPGDPELASEVLRESGYGVLAEEWLSSRRDFEEQTTDYQSGPLKPEILAAFARMRVCWFRVEHLKEQAGRLLDRRESR